MEPAHFVHRSSDWPLEQVAGPALQDLLGRKPDRIVGLLGFQELIDLRVRKAGVSPEIEARDLALRGSGANSKGKLATSTYSQERIDSSLLFFLMLIPLLRKGLDVLVRTWRAAGIRYVIACFGSICTVASNGYIFLHRALSNRLFVEIFALGRCHCPRWNGRRRATPKRRSCQQQDANEDHAHDLSLPFLVNSGPLIFIVQSNSGPVSIGATSRRWPDCP